MARIIPTPEDDVEVVSYYSPVARFTWFLLGIVNGLLAIRFVLRAIGANPAAGFTDFIYTITQALVAPFSGVIRSTVSGGAVIEWSTLLAMIVYWLLAWAIVSLVAMSRPTATRY